MTAPSIASETLSGAGAAEEVEQRRLPIRTAQSHELPRSTSREIRRRANLARAAPVDIGEVGCAEIVIGLAVRTPGGRAARRRARRRAREQVANTNERRAAWRQRKTDVPNGRTGRS